jgi:hypothetical protein
MLQTTLLRAPLKRGWTDTIDDAGLAFIDLDLLDQGSNDLLPCRPVRLAKTFGNTLREFLQLADHQPQFRLLVFLFGLPSSLVLQPREPFACRADPRLEFGLLQETLLISINQSRDASLDLLDQLHHLVGLADAVVFRPLSPAFVLDPDPFGLGEKAANILPDGRVQQVGADLLVPA